MRFGEKNVVVHISASDFSDMHAEPGCKGQFVFKNSKKFVHTETALGALVLANAPIVTCESCNATFVPKSFTKWLEERIFEKLIHSPKELAKKQVRFLRHHLGLTQDQLAERLDVEGGKSQWCKYESEKFPRDHLSADKQVRLRFLAYEHLKRSLSHEALGVMIQISKGIEASTEELLPSGTEIMDFSKELKMA